MAAVIDMGEVDEIHSKEETIKDGIILNGDVSSVKSNEEEEEHDSVPNEEVMEVEDVQESDENEVEATSIEIDDEDSNDSNAVIISKSDTNDKADNEVEIHSVDNSDDEVDEIVDDEPAKEIIKDIDEEDDDDDVVHVIMENDDQQIINVEDKEKDSLLEIISTSKEKEEEEKEAQDAPIFLNDSGDGDVEIIEEADLPKENGKSYSPELNETHKIDDDDDEDEDDDDDDEVITLDTPTKKAKKTTVPVESPRRSARNLNKKVRKSYAEKEEKDSSSSSSSSEEESDIEEVLPQDPLAVADPLSTTEKVVTYSNKKPVHIPVSSTIVVKDTKRLVEIASKSTPNNTGKKEPTLVIIDTNSILSGRGPIPINQKPTISQSFPVLPMALPAQGVYPPNMRATITPIPPMNVTTHSHTPKPPPLQPSPSAMQFPQLQTASISTTLVTCQATQSPQIQQQQQQQKSQPPPPPQQQQPPPPPAPILPSLTDDMFVVEAPSFIVPYVYEKPPVADLKEFVDKFAKEIRERIRAEEKERREKLEAEEKEQQLAEEKQREADDKKAKEDSETEKEKGESAVENAKSQEDDEDKDDDSEEVDDKKEVDAEKIDDKKHDVETALEKSIIPKKPEDKDKIDEIRSIVESKLSELKQIDKKEITRIPVINFDEPPVRSSNKPYSYFESPLGKFFTDIGHNLVQEYVQTDLLKQQKRKREREGGKNPETNKTITSLIKNLEYTKENNEPYHMPIKKCEFCSFKTESALAMAFHLETPHMKNFVYRCNFCPYEIRSPHDILFHMEAEHMIRGRLERAPAFHQCPNCPFEDNQKGKLSRHLVACSRKFKPGRNLDPPLEWEPPAKIPRVPRMKQSNLSSTAAMYQAMTKSTQFQLMQKMQNTQSALNRGRGRPSLGSMKQPPLLRAPAQSMIYKSSMSGGSVLLPTNYQLSGNQLYQVVGGPEMGGRIGTGAPMTLLPNISSATSTLTIQKGKKVEESGQLFSPTNLAGLKQQTSANKSKPMHQPSISITPLPRNTSAPQTPASKPGDSNSKNSFVICEICDGYIKDLEQLRNHMQWIHKVKIHPKMIYNRPPLNCQKCQFRFFTDQGLERHLLGSHGLVTSSMQEAANKSKDSGRCPVCGRVYQWKLLNHVARDHNMTLKPAHLSYKCTVCTATFGMYKQFENHVYSAHSVVAKRVMDKKTPSPSQASSNSSASAKNNDSLLKPLKINDEITIIPQMPKSSSSGATTSSTTTKEDSPASSSATKNSISVTTTPSTSKTELTRAERLARRKTSAGLDN